MVVNTNKYETVIGLEIHCQLSSNSKLFCADKVSFGDEPNTNISEISLAYPGTLPMLNKQALRMAVKMALACNATINPISFFERKHYNYPDLPKGYQLTQNDLPYCVGGYIPINVDNKDIKISLHHIHLEEDAGKNRHDILEQYSCVDYNRAGVPLIEMVTNPDIKSADEALAVMTTVKKIARYLNISDCNMEEGNLRCDVNISIKLASEEKLGTKVELKNLNSLRHIKKAIEFEQKRLIQKLENNENIIQETRGFDPNTDTTHTQRTKENAEDYRYLKDPDLPPVYITDQDLTDIKNTMPLLHFEREKILAEKYNIATNAINIICEEIGSVDYFEQIIMHIQNPDDYKAVANWMIGPIKTYLNNNKIDIVQFIVPADKVADIINLVSKSVINYSDASTILFNRIIENPKFKIETLAKQLNILQSHSNESKQELQKMITQVFGKYPDKVKEYKHDGRKGLIGFFVGEVIKSLTTKLNPKEVNDAIKKLLE